MYSEIELRKLYCKILDMTPADFDCHTKISETDKQAFLRIYLENSDKKIVLSSLDLIAVHLNGLDLDLPSIDYDKLKEDLGSHTLILLNTNSFEVTHQSFDNMRQITDEIKNLKQEDDELFQKMKDKMRCFNF